MIGYFDKAIAEKIQEEGWARIRELVKQLEAQQEKGTSEEGSNK